MKIHKNGRKGGRAEGQWSVSIITLLVCFAHSTPFKSCKNIQGQTFPSAGCPGLFSIHFGTSCPFLYTKWMLP